MRLFPVLQPGYRQGEPGVCYPKSIPWALIEPYAQQAMRNHDQTLERLAERGGLCVQEIAWLLENTSWKNRTMATDRDAVAVIEKKMKELK